MDFRQKQNSWFGRFEALMTNEFRTLNGVCSNLVPQGPGYENVLLSNQVCTTVGALPGESFVNGARFLVLSYGYSFSNTWKVPRSSPALIVSLNGDILEFWHPHCFWGSFLRRASAFHGIQYINHQRNGCCIV
jgi:hypothetical protein